jgi:hypothetical protein
VNSPYTVAPHLRQHEPARRSAVRHQDWRDRAACRGKDPALFFPEDGDSHSAAWARVICAGCPVRSECLQFALSSPERWGTWGGVSEQDRQGAKAAGTAALLEKAAAAASPPSSRHRGVRWDEGRKKWAARIYLDGRRVRLGSFTDEDAAGAAVADALRGKPAAGPIPEGIAA